MSAEPARVRDRFRFPRWGQRGTTGASIPAELAFDAVTQSYGAVQAVAGVSLTIAPGELSVCSGLPVAARRRFCGSRRGSNPRQRPRPARRTRGEQREDFVPPEHRGVG
jgi:iron(III) transport system ATP-binding protein